MRTHSHLILAVALIGTAILGASEAVGAPLVCDVVTPTECQITTLKNLGAGGTFEVDRTLHIGSTGELRTNPGSTLTLDIASSLIVDTGGRITGNAATANGRGAAIVITTAGSILLDGNGSAGALISANQSAGSCSGGKSGTVRLTSNMLSKGESITTRHGSKITANARCSGGEIKISATRGGVDIRGVVESVSLLSGVGAKQPPGGGPISISASCNLTINDTGRVSSRGNDPGADLVHLEAGGDVLVIGLVESTGVGHAVPNNPKNHCSGPERADKPLSATACVEIWAGKSLRIDGTGTNHGEINADTPRGGGSIAWIDLFAKGNITINGAGTGPYAANARPYAVHATQIVTNAAGGIINVKSVQGQVGLAGQAIQVDELAPGGAGGSVTIDAGGTSGGDVNLGTASVRARGANFGGGPQAGGDIVVRSFNGRVLGASPGELNATGGAGQPVPERGTVSLQGCEAVPPAVNYVGTATPIAVVVAPSCGGTPSLPAYVVFPSSACDVPPPCTGADCPCTGADCPCTGADCPCTGADCPCTGPDCPCTGADCPCTGPDCPCTGPDCPCTGPDCPCTGPDCPCTGPDCPCTGPDCPCTGPDCPCTGPDCPCTGPDCPCTGPDCPCTGPDCPCTGPDCPCTGPDCPCTGPDCPCTGPDCPCTGPDCPCTGPDCPCTGPDCPCTGPDCPCTGPDCPCTGPDCPCTGPDCPCTGPDCPCTGPDCPCTGPDCPCTGPDCPCIGPNCPCEGPGCLPYTSFCEKGTVKAVLDPVTGRFPGNLGPDVVVDVRTNSLQAAIDTASDTNNDGYIIIGIIALDNGLPGGKGNQGIEVTQAYGKPFAMIACGVTMIDPHSCDGRAVVHVRASATSPELPVGSGVALYFQDITATGSGSVPGWLVEGDGRLLERIGAQRNSRGGVKIVGNRNAIRNSSVSRNVGGGIVVQGHGNIIQTVIADDNVGGDGIQVTGNNNLIADNTAGNQGRGNGSSGIHVIGTGNLIKSNGAFGNYGNGITVGGGTAAAPNVVTNNVAGGPGRGNLGSGIVLGGTGQGAGGLADLLGNTTQSNLVGLKVIGTGHRLKENANGGAATRSNLVCQYQVSSGNFDATGNTRNSSPVGGIDGSPFPNGCF